jgi:sugar O-acyltransferase (sialic acid O-acetyltransferase NeuD family)
MSVLYLCGAGNSEGVRLALRINERRNNWDHVFLLDDDPNKHGRSLLGVEIAGPFSLLDGAEPDAQVQNLVARTTRKRRAAHERIARYGTGFAALVHPDVDTQGVELDADVIVYRQAILGPEVAIGAGSVVFMGAIVGHECRVGPGCVVASNAVLNARVELGEGVYVGTNATVLPEVKIGAWATIGAGAVVVDDVPPGATVFSARVEVVGAVGNEHSGDTGSATESGARAAGTACSPSESADLAETELAVSNAWKEILGREVSPHDRFFDVGGNSLLAVRLLDRLQRISKCAIGLTDVYRFATVYSMTEHLSGGHNLAGGRRSQLARGRLARARRADRSARSAD